MCVDKSEFLTPLPQPRHQSGQRGREGQALAAGSFCVFCVFQKGVALLGTTDFPSIEITLVRLLLCRPAPLARGVL
jgi:hypothetical protein